MQQTSELWHVNGDFTASYILTIDGNTKHCPQFTFRLIHDLVLNNNPK